MQLQPPFHDSFPTKVAFVLALCLSRASHILAQNVNIGDLPSCASTCALTAATAAGCSLLDTSCLCGHPAFTTATVSCARSFCTVEDISTVNGELQALCVDSGATTTITGTTAHSFTSGSIASSVAPSTTGSPRPTTPTPSSRSQISSTGTVSSATSIAIVLPGPTSGTASSSGTPNTTTAASSTGTLTVTPFPITDIDTAIGFTATSATAASSTTVVVQTVIVDPVPTSSAPAQRKVATLWILGSWCVASAIVFL